MKLFLFSIMSLILTAFVSVADVNYADASISITAESDTGLCLVMEEAPERVTGESTLTFMDDINSMALLTEPAIRTDSGGDNAITTAMKSGAVETPAESEVAVDSVSILSV